MKAKSINLKPTPGYLLIEPAVAEKKTESGIYLPDTSEEKPQKGTVLAVGDDELTDSGKARKSPAKVGDEIIYKKWGGNDVKIDGKEYIFVKFEDVLAVVK
jgi:chaperonin GroES